LLDRLLFIGVISGDISPFMGRSFPPVLFVSDYCSDSSAFRDSAFLV